MTDLVHVDRGRGVERLPDPWRWDSPGGQWCCHAYVPSRFGRESQAITIHHNGSLLSMGVIPAAVVLAVVARARRVGFLDPTGLSE